MIQMIECAIDHEGFSVVAPITRQMSLANLGSRTRPYHCARYTRLTYKRRAGLSMLLPHVQESAQRR